MTRLVPSIALVSLVASLFFVGLGHSDDKSSAQQDRQESAATALRRVIDKTIAKRAEVLENSADGEHDPAVRKLDLEISHFKSRLLLQKGFGSTSVESMNDKQLRATIEILINRVVALEERVHELTKPRVQLLTQ